MSNLPPIAYTIAGSDSCCGAGAQIDLKVFSNLNVHGCSILTVITAQNTIGISDVFYLPNTIIKEQYESIINDLPPNALKISMVGNGIEIIVEKLKNFKKPIIFDPVISSTSNYNFINEEQISRIKKDLLPLCTLITPNLPEAKKLIGRDDLPVEDIAKCIIDYGPSVVLLKGGHSNEINSRDFLYDGENKFFLESPRITNKSFHGTGCVLSAAITSYISKGKSVVDSTIEAKTYLNQLLNKSPQIGKGSILISVEPPCNDSYYKPNIVCVD